MSAERHTRYERWMERAFTGELAARRWPELRAHVRACVGCRTRYDQLGRVLGPMALEWIGDEVVGVQARPILERTWLRAALALSTVALAAGILLVVLDPPQRPALGEWVERGHEVARRPPGVVFFCVQPVHERITGSARAWPEPLPVETLRCKIDSDLQLAYSTPRLKGIHMTARGRGAAGTVHTYADATLEADVLDRPLPESTRLAVNHRPGEVVDVEVSFDGSAPHRLRLEVVP